MSQTGKVKPHYGGLSVITNKMILELEYYGFKPNKETHLVANISLVMYNAVVIKIYRRIYGALTLTLFLIRESF